MIQSLQRFCRLCVGFRMGPEAVVALTMLSFMGAAGYVWSYNLLTLIFAMAASIVMMDFPLTVWNLRRIHATRDLPTHVYAGQSFSVPVTLDSQRQYGRAFAVVAEDTLRLNGARVRPSPKIHFVKIDAQQQVRRRYTATLNQRGLCQFGSLRISSWFPFGFFGRVIGHVKPMELLVYPRMGRLTYIGRELLSPNRVEHQGRARKGAAFGDEFRALREYRDGDSRRWIHWRTSARKEELMVKEFEQEHALDVAILLDLWSPNQPELRHLQICEQAISFAATLVSEACQRGAGRVVLVVAGVEEHVVSGMASRHVQHHALAKLALAQPAASPVLCGESEVGTSESMMVISTRHSTAEAVGAMADWVARRSPMVVTASEFDQYFDWGAE